MISFKKAVNCIKNKIFFFKQTKDETKKKEKYDEDNRYIDLKSRNQFLEQVVETIKENYGSSEGSFIFGLSGQWGEGKTSFLTRLEEKLKDEFVIVKINPWKYTDDKIAFLRNFLKKIGENVGFKSKELSQLFYYTNESKINWHFFWIYLLVTIFIILFIIISPNNKVFNYIKNTFWLKLLFLFILLPSMPSIISSLIISTESNPNVNAIDNFDEILDKIIKKAKDKGKKFLIFVDDLDRVSAKTAIIVLDTLRTFFDKENLSFVITGDHTVLERHIGKNLVPDKKQPEQVDEGRRFLKKVFNVYWRLPIPLISELIKFIDNKMGKRFNSLFDNAQKDTLKKWLFKYFKRNFRNIIRFLDTIEFTFKVIARQSNENDADIYLNDLRNNPLLVVRILMLQELCNPFYEYILTTPAYLLKIEGIIQKTPTSFFIKTNIPGDELIYTDNFPTLEEPLKKIKDEIKNLKDISLSDFQKNFLFNFLLEKPRFYNEYGPVISDIKSFLYLISDISFNDIRGPAGDEFINILKQKDSEKIKESLAIIGQDKINKTVDDTFNFLSSSNIPNQEKYEYLLTLVRGIKNIDVLFVIHGKMLSKFSDFDFSFLQQLRPEYMVSFLHEFTKWLDPHYQFLKNKNLINKYYDKFSLPQHALGSFLNSLTQDNQNGLFGIFSSEVISKNLITYWQGNKSFSDTWVNSFFPKLNIDILKKYLFSIKDELLNSFLNTNRELYFQILLKYINDGEKLVRETITKEIYLLNQNIWNWVANNNKFKIVSKEELEKIIIERLEKEEFDIDFFSFSRNKINREIEKFWNLIIKNNFEEFLNILPNISNDRKYNEIIPPKKFANTLFKKIIDYIIEKQEDISILNTIIPYLHKNYLIWKNLEKIPAFNIKSIKNQNIKNILSNALDSWRNK